jgi:hypothetical protein
MTGLLVASTAHPPRYSIVSTVVAVVGTFVLIAITVWLAMRSVKRAPGRERDDGRDDGRPDGREEPPPR